MSDVMSEVEVLQHPEAKQKILDFNLSKWIAASVALHLAASAFVFGGHPSRTTPAVTYLDLKSVQLPAAAAPPQARAQVAPPPTPEPFPQPEVKPAPQPAADPKPSTAHPPAAAVEPAPPEQPTTGLGLGMTRGYFDSIGKGETLRDDIREYYLAMLQRINEHWWLAQGKDKRGIRPVMVNLVIDREGRIVAQQLMMGSGDPGYDKAVLAALESAGPLPPLPREYGLDYFTAPIRLVPPLNLMGG